MSGQVWPAGAGGGGDLPDDILSRLLPVDGAPDQLLKRAVLPNGVAAWGDPPDLGKYRGAWGLDDEKYFDAFVDNTAAPLVAYQPGSGVPGAVTVEGMATNTGTGKPVHTNTSRMAWAITSSGQRGGCALPLSTIPALAGLTVSRVKLWAVWTGTFTSRQAEILEGEALRQTIGGTAWTEYTLTLASGGAANLNFQVRNTGSTAGTAVLYVTGISVLAAADPYMRGDVVDHLGTFYKSLIDNNGNTPGAHASWVVVAT